MAEKKETRHEHRGRSSRGILDPGKVLTDAPRKSDVFLDAGCGDGLFSVAASAIVGEQGRIYAVDVDAEAISRLKQEIARKGIANIKAFVADVSKQLPLADQSVDVALMANVLHGLVANGEAEGALREIARVVRAGGKLLVVDFKKIATPSGPPLSIRLSPEEVEALTGRYGFTEDGVREAGEYHYIVILAKR